MTQGPIITHTPPHTLLSQTVEKREVTSSLAFFPFSLHVSLYSDSLFKGAHTWLQWGLSTFSGLKVQVLNCSFRQMSVRFCGFYYMTITTITDICEPRLLKKCNRNESEIALWVAYNRYVDSHNSQSWGKVSHALHT